MKNLVLTTALATMVTFAFGQTNQRTYGPKAKNERVWVNKENKSQLVTNSNEQVTGGVAKNNQTWAKNYNNSETTATTDNAERLAMKGPSAKNYHSVVNRTRAAQSAAPQNNLADK